MITHLLVVTPEPGFGKQITKGLDAKRFEVLVTADFSDAIRFVRKVNCSVAILDTDLEDEHISISDIGNALRQINPTIDFIVIAPEGRESKPGELTPMVTFPKPVSISEIEKLLTKGKGPAPKAKNAPDSKSTLRASSKNVERDMAETANLMWLKDVSRAAQHLTQLTLESSAQAALITREDELWAYAGQLSRDAAQELGQSIQHYWNKESESDLLRFVRLESTEAQHMLYARKLSASMILALVFDAETPFSTIRAQAGKLVRTLAEPHPGEFRPAQVAVSVQPTPAPAPAEEPPVLSFSANVDEDGYSDDLPPISELLGDIPSPIPVRQAVTPKVALPWEQAKAKAAPGATETVAASVRRPAASFSREAPPLIETAVEEETSPAMDETRLSSVSRAALETERRQEVAPELQETRRQQLGDEEDVQSYIETRAQNVTESVTQAAHRILLEPASPSLVNLTYACLLIPRFDTHHLVGDPAERLTEWVPQLCIAFGWRLEHLAVRPEYLQWVVRVPPSTAPGYIMRIIRQQTSDRLFSDFTRYKKENPSGDFWAPGYLIMGSSQPHPQKLVRDFVRQTRQRQGLEK